MSNVIWPRRPDLCNRDGRDCRKYEEKHSFTLRDGNGAEVARFWAVGDFGLEVTGLAVEETVTPA